LAESCGRLRDLVAGAEPLALSQVRALLSNQRLGPRPEEARYQLSKFGTVTPLAELCDRETYLFSSGTGFEVAFFLNDDQFTFFGDNTTWRPK
jgi:hypothetical protein